jgi:L-alanine-DL-glutamate epimerase-like enolase superfamily enzyme
VLKEPVELKDGFVLPSRRPGLGMAWNEKAVKRFLV